MTACTRLRTEWVWVAAILCAAALSGCSWFGSDTPEEVVPPTVAEEAQTETPGLLRSIAELAPAGSTAQYLGQIADDLGWEVQVAQNTQLRAAVADEAFDERVEPALLSLYFRNGFSILPIVGNGHQFGRDTVVRGVIGSARLLVTTREPLRIIFLQPVQDVLVIYPIDGEQPQVFSLDSSAVINVRRSLLEHYLR